LKEASIVDRLYFRYVDTGVEGLVGLNRTNAPVTCETLWQVLAAPVQVTCLNAMFAGPEIMVGLPESARDFDGPDIPAKNQTVIPAADDCLWFHQSENMMYVVSTNVAGPIGFSLDGTVTGGRSQIIDYRGEMLACETAPDQTTAVSAMIDVGALRSAWREKGLANTLLRSRFEMYEPALAGASFYPPNSFRGRPMADTAALAPVVEAALANMAKAGVLG
jgi:hypothetical protein